MSNFTPETDERWEHTIPLLGSYYGLHPDPKGVEFLRSIGYPEETARKYSSYPAIFSFSRTGRNDYKLTIFQPEINRNQEIPFQLGADVLSIHNGQPTRSLYEWNKDARTLIVRSSKEPNIRWEVRYVFDDGTCKLVRTSSTISTETVHYLKDPSNNTS